MQISGFLGHADYLLNGGKEDRLPAGISDTDDLRWKFLSSG